MGREYSVIAVVSSHEADRQGLEAAISEVGLSTTCQQIVELDELSRTHRERGIDIVALFPDRSPVDGHALRDLLASMPAPPSLLLAVDRFRPEDYIRAGTLQAEDVIAPQWGGHLELAIRRTLRTLELRRQLAATREQLANNQVVNRSTLAETPAPEAIPPLVEALDEALRNEGLRLLFQPVVAIDGDEVESYEVFVRLEHQGRAVPPDEFLPIAARYGLMPALDRWVVRNAVQRFVDEKRARRGRPRGLRFFLNVSAHTLIEERAAESLLKIIARARPATGEFVIKLDKDTIFSRLAPAKTLNRLARKVGLQFALDHYEHSDRELNFLDHVAVDYIKLHGSMTHGIDRDPRKRQHVTEILDNARQHGICVIAGQVERPTELATLFSLGVDYVQGFQVGPPDAELAEPLLGD